MREGSVISLPGQAGIHPAVVQPCLFSRRLDLLRMGASFAEATARRIESVAKYRNKDILNLIVLKGGWTDVELE